MGLEDFKGKWEVRSSGRARIPAGQGRYLLIDTDGGAEAWTLKTQKENDEPEDFGQLSGRGHQQCRTHGLQRIHCTVSFDEDDYYFEAVLAKNPYVENCVIYGHLYPKTSESGGGQGEGAVGGWSAEKQGSDGSGS